MHVRFFGLSLALGAGDGLYGKRLRLLETVQLSGAEAGGDGRGLEIGVELQQGIGIENQGDAFDSHAALEALHLGGLNDGWHGGRRVGLLLVLRRQAIAACQREEGGEQSEGPANFRWSGTHGLD